MLAPLPKVWVDGESICPKGASTLRRKLPASSGCHFAPPMSTRRNPLSQALAKRTPWLRSQRRNSDSADRIIESFQDAGDSALESVRRYLDTVNGVFPGVGADGGARKEITDSAFKMTEQLVGTSSQLAQRIVKASQDAQDESDKDG